MIRKTRAYRDVLLERLSNPEVASHYLNATLNNSPENFLTALKNVAKARQISKVAKDSGIQRETVYRSLSDQGNPTWDTLTSLAGVLGLKFQMLPEDQEIAVPGVPVSSPLSTRNAKETHIVGPLENSGQLEVAGFENAVWMTETNKEHSQEALLCA